MQWGPQYFGGVGSGLSKVYRSINITLSDLNLELHRSSLKGKNGFFLLPQLSGFNVTFRKILICDALCWSWKRFSSIKFIYWWLDRRKATGRTDASIHGWTSSIPTGTESPQCSFQQSKTNISDNQTLFGIFFITLRKLQPAAAAAVEADVWLNPGTSGSLLQNATFFNTFLICCLFGQKVPRWSIRTRRGIRSDASSRSLFLELNAFFLWLKRC